MRASSTLLAALTLSCALSSTLIAETPAKKTKPKAWTDVETAKKEVPGFDLMGEYIVKDGEKTIQVGLQGDKFFVTEWAGPLFSEKAAPGSATMSLKTADEVKALIKDAKRSERTSPTMGLKAPEGAVFPFGKDTFTHGQKSEQSFGSFKMHMEFLLPLKPGRNLSNQDRGNSGVYIYNIYECQVLDSFPLDYHTDTFPMEKTESRNDQWCACLYKKKKADANAGFPPLTWQTYDIDFTAPEFDGDKKVKNARLTLKWNGIVVHDDVELDKGTGMGSRRKEMPKGQIFVQDHGNPVSYRNTWLIEK